MFSIAALLSSGLWLATRAAGLADVEVLPARCLRRVRWWQGNARYVQSACAVIGIAAACVQIGATVG
jgi:hypothetical protein